jgi:putative tricarboxylic transport membrane protein
VLQNNRGKRQQRLVGVAVLIAAIFFGAGIPFIDGQSGYAGLSPRFLPSVVAVGLSICGLAFIFGPHAIIGEVPEQTNTLYPHHRFKRLGLIIAGLVGHMALIGWIGFVLASALLMAATARAYGSPSTVKNALWGLAIAAGIWLIFTQLLGLNLALLPLLERVK